MVVRGAESKNRAEGRQGRQGRKVDTERQRAAMTASTVPIMAKQEAETYGIPGVEAAIWTERMVSALVNGVEGGRWYSLMDKVCAPATLQLAWQKVKANRGMAGVDGMSVGRFARQADRYPQELGHDLRQGTYRAGRGQAG